MKIRRVRAELFHSDGRTDRQDEAFRNFENAPKTVKSVAHNWFPKKNVKVYTYRVKRTVDVITSQL